MNQFNADPKETGVNCYETRLISKLYMDQSFKYDWTKGRQMCRMEEELGQGCCLPQIPFNIYSEYLTNKALEGFGDLTVGQVICTVKYADDLVVLAKEQTVL
jgi:hypothetical protein